MSRLPHLLAIVTGLGLITSACDPAPKPPAATPAPVKKGAASAKAHAKKPKKLPAALQARKTAREQWRARRRALDARRAKLIPTTDESRREEIRALLKEICPEAKLQHRHLSLRSCAIKHDARWKKLVGAPLDVEVRGIAIYKASVEDDALVALLKNPSLVGLSSIQSDAKVGVKSAAQLTTGPYLFRSLSLRGAEIPAPQLVKLVSSEVVMGAFTLRLSSATTSDEVLAALVKGPACPSLRELDLSHASVTDAGLAHLDASCLSRLGRVSLNRTKVTDAGVTAALKVWANQGRKTRELGLAHTAITDATLRALATSALPGLVHINLNGAKVTDDGIKALTGLHQRFPRSLCLDDTAITDAALEAMAGAPKVQRVDLLSLRRTAVSDAGLVKLLSAPAGQRLRNLMVTDAKQVRGAFIEAFASPRKLPPRKKAMYEINEEGQLDAAGQALATKHRSAALSIGISGCH